MKRRGFTLVELLAVLVLISAIVLIAVPSIINYINKSKDDISDVTQKIIYSGAKLYVDSKPNEYKPEVGKNFCVSLQSIVEANYLSSPILDSVSGEEIDLNTKVILNYVYDTELEYNKYEYSLAEQCDTEGPVITFGTDGSNGSWLAEANTKVTATDSSGIKSISYGWSTSSTSTSTDNITTSDSVLTSKCSRDTNGLGDGDCYLYVKACDNYDNCTEKRTNSFKLDVTAPKIITLSHSSCTTGLKMNYQVQDTGSGVIKHGYIYCDKDLDTKNYVGYCYDLINDNRYNTISSTQSIISNSGSWTTSSSTPPETGVGYSFWVRAVDAVGNVGQKDNSTTIGDLVPYVGTGAC